MLKCTCKNGTRSFFFLFFLGGGGELASTYFTLLILLRPFAAAEGCAFDLKKSAF